MTGLFVFVVLLVALYLYARSLRRDALREETIVVLISVDASELVEAFEQMAEATRKAIAATDATAEAWQELDR